MNERDRRRLIEAAVSARRERNLDGVILPHPAWADLPEADRERIFEETRLQRRIESAIDPRRLSATGRAVLERITGAR